MSLASTQISGHRSDQKTIAMAVALDETGAVLRTEETVTRVIRMGTVTTPTREGSSKMGTGGTIVAIVERTEIWLRNASVSDLRCVKVRCANSPVRHPVQSSAQLRRLAMTRSPLRRQSSNLDWTPVTGMLVTELIQHPEKRRLAMGRVREEPADLEAVDVVSRERVIPVKEARAESLGGELVVVRQLRVRTAEMFALTTRSRL